MFDSRPTLKSTFKYMTLNGGKILLHLEIDKDVFWNLTKCAADDQMHPEEWLEIYLKKHFDTLEK